MLYDEIIETIRMIEKERLDIRTITMGISLMDCFCEDIHRVTGKIYDKIMNYAGNLVRVCEEIESDYGISIANKRISVTPTAFSARKTPEDYVQIIKSLDRAAEDAGVDFLGGFSALVQKGMTPGDMALMESMPEAFSVTKRVCGCVNVGSTRSGINLDAVKKMGGIIKKIAYESRNEDSIGCAKLVVFANAVEDNPFMAGAFHGPGEGEVCVNVGVSGPGAVYSAIEKLKGHRIDEICEIIKRTAFKITRAGQLVGNAAAERLGVPFGILDLSLAPTTEEFDSVALIIEEMGIEKCGAHGTTAALALLTDAVKKGGIMASSHVGGLSGAFIPVSEDKGMIDSVKCGAITFDKLEAMTSVCSVGLDMIAIPGDTPEETISAIIADEASIGVINNKTTAVRLIPVWGKGPGESAVFGGLLGYAPIMEVSRYSSAGFINRGGRIPAPVHSFKN
ncbi:MAG: PFL family protein [Eubacteriaceae bacterium]|nr:PFL family protein [Eubacteriaceae bacterium]